MIKRTLVVLSIALVINVAMGDPFDLRHFDIKDVYREVCNFAVHISRGEYALAISNSMQSAPHKH